MSATLSSVIGNLGVQGEVGQLHLSHTSRWPPQPPPKRSRKLHLDQGRYPPDGAEALGVLAESKSDLVVLDWDLAILSGEEFIRLTRDFSTSPCPTMPIILMMAQPREDRVKRAVRLDVNEVVAKPFSPKTLWSRLDEVINRPRPYTQVKSLL